ncbi:DNA helicase [Tanacetum coccineum]
MRNSEVRNVVGYRSDGSGLLFDNSCESFFQKSGSIWSQGESSSTRFGGKGDNAEVGFRCIRIAGRGILGQQTPLLKSVCYLTIHAKVSFRNLEVFGLKLFSVLISLSLAGESSSTRFGGKGDNAEVGFRCIRIAGRGILGQQTPLLKLYIYDTENEVANRMRHFEGSTSGGLDPAILTALIHFLDEHNELVRLFRTARDKVVADDVPSFRIRLFSVVGAWEYDLLSSETLGTIVFERGVDTKTDYDVIIESKYGFPQRVNKLHPSYMSLQFPLLFIHGRSGFYPEIKQRNGDKKRLSMNMYYMYQLHEQSDSYGFLFKGGRLFQHYVVDVYCCIEQNRIDFYKTQQSDIRSDYLSGVHDAISRGDREGYEIGARIILPRNHKVSKRQSFLDLSMDYPGSLSVDTKHKIQNAEEIDGYISAKLPDPKSDPDGYRVVSETMVHGACGLADSDAVCMKEGICGKKFPKKYNDNTFFDKDGPVGEPPAVADNVCIKRDEIQNFINGRYRQPLKSVVKDDGKRKITLNEWLVYNELYKDGRHLTYVDFTKEFVWYPDLKTWKPRQRINVGSIGRLANVHPSSDTLRLWKIYWRKMSEDIPITTSKSIHIKDLYMNDPELEGGVLYELEIILNTYSKTVKDFGLPSLSKRLLAALRNKELMEEKGYNQAELAKEVASLVPKLNSDRKLIYDIVFGALNKNKQELILVYGHGGTGKTFLWKTLISAPRLQGKIVLAVESLGIASLLLLAGHMIETDSRWTLRDILDVPNKLFGGKSIVLGGDFRQTLPVKKGASKAEIIVKTKKKAALFASWLLDITDGKIRKAKENSDGSSSWIDVPEKYCIPDDPNGLPSLIRFIYDDETLQMPSTLYKSSDEVIPVGNDRGEVELLYPLEYLNTLLFSDFPPHQLELKGGAPIMLLRNMNLQGGMCNGTRMIIKKLWSKLIEAQVITKNRVFLGACPKLL